MDRELDGLQEAMNYFGVQTASLITHDQSDTFTIGGKTISAQPFHQWEKV
ncbi:MAG: hypothetical protein WCK09_21815 [Bacteroidota bacterium]